jgi:hypothetical protein
MNNPIVCAEKLLNKALDNLEATGALQRSNHMDIVALLNPAIETCNIFDVTDEDIFESVMGAKKLRERNAEGDNELEVDVVVAPGPMRSELLQAVSMLRKHIGTVNNRKLEVMLGQFGQWTRAVGMQGTTDTKLTDYFIRK